jgi:carbon-monoxide dehydrogenase medium subunit
MKPVAFDYVRPGDIDSAVKIMAGSNGTARLLAGGQSLGPMLNLRLARPGLVVDIARIAELRAGGSDGAYWRIGAASTHAEIEDGLTPLGGSGFLPAVARQIAYRAIRNRGTIGGSLAHGDPAADWPLALAAHDAMVEIRGPQGRRRIEADRFLVAPFTTVLAEDEIIVSILVPQAPPDLRWGYFKLCRKAGEFPIASAAVVASGGACRVFIGALPDKPRPLPLLAQELAGMGSARITAAALADAVAQAAPDIDQIDRRIYVACLSRAIQQAFGT